MKVAFVMEVCCKAKRVVAKRKEVPRRINGEHDSKRREEVDTRRDSTNRSNSTLKTAETKSRRRGRPWFWGRWKRSSDNAVGRRERVAGSELVSL